MRYAEPRGGQKMGYKLEAEAVAALNLLIAELIELLAKASAARQQIVLGQGFEVDGWISILTSC